MTSQEATRICHQITEETGIRYLPKLIAGKEWGIILRAKAYEAAAAELKLIAEGN